MKNNKKTYRKNLKIEIISDILIIVILIMNIFSQNVIKIKATEEKNGSYDSIIRQKGINTKLQVSDIPKAIKDAIQFNKKKIKTLDSVDALDLYSLTTIKENNVRELHIFDNPIKYYDRGKNEVKFIDNTLIKSNEKTEDGRPYAYENNANAIKIYIPKTNNDGICIKNELNQTIEFSLITKEQKNVKLKKEKIYNEVETIAEYKDILGKGYNLQYIAQNDGIKENIIIEKNNGIYEFDFILKMQGMHPDNTKGKYIELVDNKNDKTAFTLGEIFIKDSFKGLDVGNKHISFNNYYIVEKQNDNEYKVRYILDKEFFCKSDTVYPIIIDPSVSPTKSIADAPVYSGMPKKNFKTNAWIEIGKIGGDYGVGYGYFQTDSIKKYKYINSNNITKASLNVYEGSGTSYSSNISVYDSNGTWNNSSITWNNRPGKTGSPLDTVKVTKSGFYDFNITSLVKKWLKNELNEGGSSYKKGVILAPRNSENKRKDFCSSNYGTGEKRPSITIEYKEDESIKNNIYFIENYNSKLHLAANDYNVFQYQKTYMERQQWSVKNVGNGCYTIANRYYGNKGYLNMTKETTSKVNADIWQDGSGNTVKYKIVKNNDGSETYRIISKQLDDIMALKVKSGSVNSGANVNFEDFVGKNASKWKFSVASSRYTVPDVYVKNITSLSKIVTPLSQYRFNIKIANKYTKIATTKTKVEILDNNSNIIFNTIVNTDSIYGGNESEISFKWKPEKVGSYTIKVTANYDKLVNEYDYSNNLKNFNIEVKKGCYLKVNHVLDHGFVTLLGNGNEKKAINLVDKVTDWVAQYYKNYQGIIIDDNISVFTSSADECKYELMKRQGENRSFGDLLNVVCPFDTKAHKPSCTTSYRPLLDYVWNKQKDYGYPVVWTGHMLFADIGGLDECDRSFRISKPDGICMITRKHKDDFLEYTIRTLLHEMAHTLGVKDHYHETDENDICRNKQTCSECGINPRSKKCIMYSANSYSDIISCDKNTFFCQDCNEDIINFRGEQK